MLPNLLNESEVKELQSLISQAQNIVITCHVSPDGDAVGSMTALYHYLRRINKNVSMVAPNIFPDFLKWIPGANDIHVYEKNEEVLNPIITAADLFMFVDFNEPKRMEKLGDAVKANSSPKVLIDHHLNPTDFGSVSCSHPEMCATCEIILRLLLQLSTIDEMTPEEATCLYVGMMTDTGGFIYNSSRSEIYEAIGVLLSKGIDKDKIYRNVFYTCTTDRFRLMGYLLYVKMKTFPEYRASLMTLTKDERKLFSCKNGDTEGFVNIPLQINGMRLSVFMREDTEKKNVIRVSLRSVDDFPCNAMAADFFNGGGHLNAAGGEVVGTMEQAEVIFKEALKKYAPLLREVSVS